MRLLSKYHQACVDRQSHHLFGLTRSPELVCRRERFTERQLLFLFNFHMPKIAPETFPSLWGVTLPRMMGTKPRSSWLRGESPSVARSIIQIHAEVGDGALLDGGGSPATVRSPWMFRVEQPAPNPLPLPSSVLFICNREAGGDIRRYEY